MSKLTQIAIKNKDGTFGGTYDIGASATNVTLSNGTTVEAKLAELKKATSSAIGMVRPDNATIKIDGNGIISSTNFVGTWSAMQTGISNGTIKNGAICFVNK